jgi:hypothetical protein
MQRDTSPCGTAEQGPSLAFAGRYGEGEVGAIQGKSCPGFTSSLLIPLGGVYGIPHTACAHLAWASTSWVAGGVLGGMRMVDTSDNRTLRIAKW